MISELKMIYNLYPRRFFTTFSWTVNSFDEFLLSMKKNIGNTRCSSSVYNYNGAEDTVTLDRIAFDIDTSNSYEDMVKLHNYLLDKDIKHFINFSGANYHVYAKVNGNPRFKKDVIRNISNEYCEKVGIVNDQSMIGNLAHNLSIPWTFNFKRMRYVRPLTQKEINLGHDKIIELALKQSGEVEVFGKEVIDSTPFDYASRTYLDLDGIEETKLDNIPEQMQKDFPEKLRKMLSLDDPSHSERLEVIGMLCDFGLGRKMIIQVLREWLSPSKFYHCVVLERQVDWMVAKRFNVLRA